MSLIFYCVFLGYLVLIDSAFYGEGSGVAEKFAEYFTSTFADETENNNDLRNVHTAKVTKNRNEDYDVEERRDKTDRWTEKYGFNTAQYTTMKEYENSDVVEQVVPDVQKPETDKIIAHSMFRIDPVLNSLRRNPRHNRIKFRRAAAPKRTKVNTSQTDVSASSSSREMKDWKQEFLELWQHKKFEALNHTNVAGDKVNMVGARPWGVPCGDPNQHDIPWGSCMLSAECEPEFRIYRGDVFCGRTQFVCCGIQFTNYDHYQGFDVSFDDKSLSTDSDEFKVEKKRSNKKAKRIKEREDRKKKIKVFIKKIIHKITRMLNAQYNNATKGRKTRTKQLKRFIKHLKRQYKKDRKAVKDLHDSDLIQIDASLMHKLNEIRKLNRDFMSNATFREIVTSGMMTMKGARMLVDAYPDLEDYMREGHVKKLDKEQAPDKGGRRSGGGLVLPQTDEVDYDVEYGYLYY